MLAVRVGEQDGVVHRGTQLHGVDNQKAQVVQRIAREVRHGQVQEDGRLDGGDEDDGERGGFERQHQHQQDGRNGDEVRHLVVLRHHSAHVVEACRHAGDEARIPVQVVYRGAHLLHHGEGPPVPSDSVSAYTTMRASCSE